MHCILSGIAKSCSEIEYRKKIMKKYWKLGALAMFYWKIKLSHSIKETILLMRLPGYIYIDSDMENKNSMHEFSNTRKLGCTSLYGIITCDMVSSHTKTQKKICKNVDMVPA